MQYAHHYNNMQENLAQKRFPDNNSYTFFLSINISSY